MVSSLSTATGHDMHQTDTPQVDQIEAWRLHVLIQAGYPYDAADLLAALARVDLHQAVYLIESGCSSELAIQILT